MNANASALPHPDLPPASHPARKRRTPALKPYTVWITFTPEQARGYTVHIRPARQRTVPCRAYFSETDLRSSLAQCLEEEAIDRMIARTRTSGIYDVRGTTMHLNVAHAAALGWFGAAKYEYIRSA